jgi:hypothetical protein
MMRRPDEAEGIFQRLRAQLRADFFQPLHFSHLPERCPEVVEYLALPPGSRFLIADGYENVWHDPTIVHV